MNDWLWAEWFELLVWITWVADADKDLLSPEND